MDDDRVADEIRAAFDIVQVPTQDQLLARRQHRRRPLRPRVLLLAALLTIPVGVLVWLRPGATPTVQAWTAVPIPADAVIVARAETNCGSGGTGDKAPGTGPIDNGLPLAIIDARVNTAVAFFTDGSRYAACEFSWSDDGSVGSAMSWQGALTTTNATKLDVLTWGSSPEDGSKKGLVFGHAGQGAKQVTVQLGSGTSMTATVSGGYYLAWWPIPDTIAAITSTDSAGHTLQELVAPVLQ